MSLLYPVRQREYQMSKKGYTKVDLESLKEADKRRNIETILAVSKIFQYGKTTVPKEVRTRLEIQDGDKLVWSVEELGTISISRGYGKNGRNHNSHGF